MASSISPLSLLTSAYQSAGVQPPAAPTVSTTSDTTDNAVSPTSEFSAMEKQGQLQAYLNNSVALDVLQPSGQVSGAAPNSTTLIQNLLQQVLGAYNAQTNSNSTPAPTTPTT